VVEHEPLEWVHARGVADRLGRPAQHPQVAHAHLKRWLLRLVGGADRVVDAGLTGHLDVPSEQVGDGMALREGQQPVHTSSL
jgi:hypothetical protein